MNRILKGALAGLAATVPMTIAMKLMHRQLPDQERYPLPPRLIIDELTKKTDPDGELGEEEEFYLTVISHFAYGAACGAIFNLAREQTDAEVSTGIGTVYGLGVWTGSYLVLLPALGILTPATEHPMRRNLLMIAAHVVWGVSLGGILRLLDQGDETDER
jgi:uncharacterized membrane protein YagU involved in acid resistance